MHSSSTTSAYMRKACLSTASHGIMGKIVLFLLCSTCDCCLLLPYQQDSDRARRSQGSDKPGGGAAALASATSVTSRYISYLQSSRNVVSSKTPPTSTGSIVPDHGPAQPRAKMHVGLSCCGRDAADAAISVEDPDLMATLEAWEAATVAAASGTEEKAGVEMRENNHAGEAQPNSNTQKVGLVGKKESGSVAEEEEEEEEEGRAATKEGSNVASREDQKEKKGAMGSALERATKVLRTLDEEADVQAALCMGPANAWVVKPAGSSCGRGVEVVSTLRGLVSACQRLEWKAVVQKYVERPLLVQVSDRHRVECFLSKGSSGCPVVIRW